MKIEAIEYSKKFTIAGSAKKFKCDRKRVREWRQNENDIRKEFELANCSNKRMRILGGGRKEKSAEINQTVLDWVQNARNDQKHVSRKLIKLKAEELSTELVRNQMLPEGSFTASNGWLEKFMNRNNLSLRRVTTTCQKYPSDIAPILTNFFMYVRQLKIKEKYHDNHIFAADETAIWVDPYGKTCITNKGAKEVAVQSTGHEKLRITVMLCAKANGDKCLPFVLTGDN